MLCVLASPVGFCNYTLVLRRSPTSLAGSRLRQLWGRQHMLLTPGSCSTSGAWEAHCTDQESGDELQGLAFSAEKGLLQVIGPFGLTFNLKASSRV